jgi:chemotaxis protein methyltransferase CheR
MGSDICEPAVERAKSGAYSQFEVQRGLPIQRLVKNFIQKGQEWVVRPELRSRVTFKLLNLMELPPMMGPFDVVFCRNVLIYFDVDTKRKVLSAIAQRMKPNGYLLLGSAETTLGVSDRFALVPSAAGLYRLV